MGAGIEPIYDYQHVVVEFEDDIVVHVELVESKSGCTSTGICMPTRQEVVFYVSKGILDRKAKEFQGIVGECSLYIYATDGWNRFSLDSFRNAEINSDLYIRVYLQLGSHSFRTFSPSGAIQEEIIECEGVEQIFLELSGEGRPPWRNYSIKFVTDEIGRQAISERNLYLSP